MDRRVWKGCACEDAGDFEGAEENVDGDVDAVVVHAGYEGGEEGARGAARAAEAGEVGGLTVGVFRGVDAIADAKLWG